MKQKFIYLIQTIDLVVLLLRSDRIIEDFIDQY